MAQIVLVHGGWAGGWQWRAVADHLRAIGHNVFTPTLTGLGERVHLGNPSIGLETHIQDILNVFRFEEINNCTLVGYSYSGIVITGVADRIPEQIAQLVYLDAFLPHDGQSLADIVGPQAMEMMSEIARQFGDGWRIPHNPPDAPRRTDMPIQPTMQPLHLKNPLARVLPRTYILCTEGKSLQDPIMAPMLLAAANVKNDPLWQYYELPTGHSPWETMPVETARILSDIASKSA